MKLQLNQVVAGLVGGLFTLVLVVACGSGPPRRSDDDVSSDDDVITDDDVAGDDDVAPDSVSVLDCTQWEFTLWSSNSDPDCIADGDAPSLLENEWCSVPAGWEPFSNSGTTSSYLVLRRCVSTS